MQLRYLKTFIAVATTLNFTRAAERVHLAQSSVTEQIQALEADLGAMLLDRSNRQLRLTAAGQQLLEYAQALLDLADEARAAVADAAKLPRGRLTIGGLETLCATRLSPLLAHFAQAHPSIELQLKASGSGELRNALRSAAMDVCFAFSTLDEGEELQSEIIGSERLVIIVPPGHRLARATEVGPGDIAKEPFLVTEQGCVYRHMFDTAFSAQRPRIAAEVASLAAIRSLVEAGMGCALLPEVALAGSNSAVHRLTWHGDMQTVPVMMVWRHRRVQPPALKLFLDEARASFATLTPADARRPRAAQSR
ncbi:LysR family transcriptional regulator [Dyella choica]|uniref:LysR family transcriptional regulator n=1 Tax=Dyella choica TaxID=1927959 RepID=A0A432MA93_9GAMM|nr:LysR family transcriptional regulator [Dyella choica]RUL79639.1 LysR family transcriptional regulator [Dyella choica]